MLRKAILTIFGTRPEVIKLAPIVLQLEAQRRNIRTINAFSGQHPDLVDPLIELFGLRVDYDFNSAKDDQEPCGLLRRIISDVSEVVRSAKPDLIVVQGDTTTALAGAIAGHRRGVPVAHVEAGLRSGNLLSPYPEEMNRVAIAQLASLHFAATESNRRALLAEGVAEDAILVTGNPIVDAMRLVLQMERRTCCCDLVRKITGRKYLVVTTHRRESFGPTLRENLKVLRAFVERHEDLVLVIPVHPNPSVHIPVHELLAEHPRIFLTPPLLYIDFLRLLSGAWLVVSDSGGIQEEVPSLGKPLLILRENTERPECIEGGMARLVGGQPNALLEMLEDAYREDSWVSAVQRTRNPFGDGHSAERIARHLLKFVDDPSFCHAGAARHLNSDLSDRFISQYPS